MKVRGGYQPEGGKRPPLPTTGSGVRRPGECRPTGKLTSVLADMKRQHEFDRAEAAVRLEMWAFQRFGLIVDGNLMIDALAKDKMEFTEQDFERAIATILRVNEV